jgi:cyclic pyranopterin phosphate synthase
MEGNAVSSPITCNDEYRATLVSFRDAFGFTEAHLTGGEPSVHPEILEMIRIARELGFVVKMTTNGQRKPETYKRFAEAGVTELNFSIHTLDGAGLAALMNPKKAADWGKRQIERQLLNIRELRDVLGRKINTVVVDDETQALAIADIARSENVHWRPMNELASGEISYQALRRLCATLNAKPVSAQIIDGSSSCSVLMESPDLAFKVKLLRDFRLSSMCDGCPVHAAGKCTEFAYGPRLEANNGNLNIRMCIHRQGEPQVHSVHTFFTSQVARELQTAMK